jgi:hypothetical protein
MADNKAAFGVFPQMKPKRSKQDREAAKNVPVDLARGFISGTLGMPGDIESLARLPYELITGNESPTILPTSSDIEKRLPFKSDSPVSQAATGLGQIGGGFYTGPLSGARAAMAVPKAVYRAGKDFVQAAGQSVSPLTVYHGSPHKFEKFDSSKIGTGEGAQAYGHGLYLAESPEVAKGYQSRLSSDRGFSYKGKAGLTRAEVQDLVNAEFGGGYLDGVTRPSGVADSIIDDMVLGTQRKTGQLPRQYKEGSERAELYKRLKNEIHHADPGSLYTVDLPDEKIARMLDWDKPLSQQPEVIKALKGTDYEVGMSQREAEKVADMRLRQEADEWAEMTGGDPVDYSNNVDWEKYVDQVRKESGSIDSSITGKDLHRMVMRDEGYRPDLFDTENYQVGTSEAMRGYGIPGIKYLDATSRDAGKGTRNFVVFPGEEDALTILERKKEGGSVSMSDNPDAQMMDVMDKKMAGGGFAKGLKAAAKAARGTQDVLPAAEREANLQRMLAESKTPMRLYHGTTASEGGKGTEAIRRLKPSKEGSLGSGVYLTPQTAHASNYSGIPNDEGLALMAKDPYAKQMADQFMADRVSGTVREGQQGGNMLPVYAQIKNPLILEGRGDPMVEALIKLGMDEASASRTVERAYENKGYIGKEVETRARAAGYDGLMQYRDGDLSEVVSYNPNAVKSAVGNKGTYDTTKPELNEAGGGLIKGLKAAAKAAKPVKGAQEVLPAAEREANLSKFLSDSKIKERLYHATPKNFTEFKPGGTDPTISGPAIWLSSDAKHQPAMHNISAGRKGEFREGVNVMPVHVQAKNPLVLDDPTMIDWAQAVFAGGSQEFPELLAPKWVDEVRKEGYDSIMFADPRRTGQTHEVIMFEPSKIKSAIGNRGTYDTSSPELNKAVGGLARMAKAAKAAKAEPSLPLNLPRAAPKTKEEIRPVAQRMAQQMTGEFVRPDPKKSINPAGKSLKQFQMERELSHDIRPTEGRTLLPQEVADIERQQGMLKIGVSGDTTIADKTLYRAGPYELDLPSPQHGGPLYGLGGEGAWASNNPVAATFQKRVQELSQANKDAPVLGQFLAMGPQGSNFALHFADANLRAIDPSKMSKQQVEQFNELIRKGTEKSGPRPGFPGIEDKESAYLHFAFDPELRKHFNALMQLPKYTDKLGLPDGRVILHAITEPELRNTEVLTSGLSQMRLDPSVNPADLMLSAHPTYSHVIPKVPESAISRTRYPVPAELEFPDVAEFIKKEYRPRDATRVYQTATPRQMVDPQHIDEMKMYEELMKEYTGKKAGGEVKMQAGGLAKLAKRLKGTQEVLPAAEREANLAKMLESSKVKDRLYHGTGADISEFKPSVIGAMGPGTYLTKNPKVASEYGNVVNLRRSTNQPNVLPVYAQITNPFEITRVNRSGSELFNRFDPSGKLTDEEVIERVKKAGYDAIHALEEGEINVLDPRKIKSAIGNRGTYNTSKPEINEAIGGLIKVKNKRKAKA